MGLGLRGSSNYLLVGYHGGTKVSLVHNIRIIKGLDYPKRLKVTYPTTRISLLDGFRLGGSSN